MKFEYKNVKSVHLEVTDKCNASCPMCPRTDHGGKLNPFVNKNELKLQDIKNIFDVNFLNQLHFIQLCGNFGDPIAASETIEILEYFRASNPNISLGLHTNGSLRNKEWWSRLGQILNQKDDYCKFALDGLEDTNAIYRRNTNWQKIMESATAFIENGGAAHWEFLVFKHNEHQIELARGLSQKMHFQKFYVKKTSRFFNYKTGQNEPYPIYNSSSEIVGYLEAPTEKKFINKVSEIQPAAIYSDPEKMSSSEIHSRVDCQSIVDKQIYISARGEIFPCCFIAGEPYYSSENPEAIHIRSTCSDNQMELTKIRATEDKKISSIVEGSFFKDIEANFTNANSVFQSCQRICKKDYKIVKAEYL